MAAMMGSGQLDPAGTALIFEERGDHRGTFVGQHAAEYFEYMVVCTGFEQSVRAFDGAGFGLGGAVNQARDACMNQGAEAHRAELDRHLQRRAGQTVITPLFRGGCQRDNFCMRAGILHANRLVVPDADHSTRGVDQDGTDRNFIQRTGNPGLVSNQRACFSRRPLRKYITGPNPAS